MKRTIVLTGLLILAGAARATVSQDANGWTVVTPSPDSRIIYVSATDGNDATTTGYVLGNIFAPGVSPRDGIPSSVTPFKTLAQGVAQMRDGYPDWILLKWGDVWNEVFPNWMNCGRSGRSSDEPLLISSYGTGPRPRINVGSGSGFSKMGTPSWNHIFIIGLEFWGNLHDPADINFDKTTPLGSGIYWLDAGDDLLVEDCSFGYVWGIVVYSNLPGYPITNVSLRRNVVVDSYQLGADASGAIFYHVNGLLMEENLFDHNGWNVTVGAPATVRNHNFYIDECLNVTVRRNLILRASSIDAKLRSDVTDGEDGVLMDNNLFFEGEIGISFDGGDSPALLKYKNFTIQNNVLLEIDKDNPTGRGLGFGIDVQDLNTGLISGNLIVNQPLYGLGGSYGIKLENHSNSGVTVQDNLLYRVNGGDIYVDVSAAAAGYWKNIVITGNAIQAAEVDASISQVYGSFPLPGVTYSNNTYFTLDSAHWADINDRFKTYSQWQALSGDTSPIPQKITYPDPLRDLTSYQQMLTGNPAVTELDFIAAARAQSRSNWKPAYTAAAVNDYIRAGFGRPRSERLRRTPRRRPHRRSRRRRSFRRRA